jgi:predicted  nucleic acid-binding Zn-ribbon protein
MEAKDSKVDRKLRMINLQMQKARLEHQIEKEENKKNKDEDDFETEGKVVMDRNDLLKRLAQAQSKIDDSDK